MSGPNRAIRSDFRGVYRVECLACRSSEIQIRVALDSFSCVLEDFLRELIQMSRCERLIYAQHIETQGIAFFDEICARDLEGVVAKRKLKHLQK